MPPRSSNPVVVFALAPNTPNIEVRVSILKAYIPLFSYIQHPSHVPTAPISLPNTSPSTLKSLIRPLRDYVIKIFCQRGAPVEKGVFSKEVGELGILRDASSWLWELEKVRKAFHNKTAVEPDWREEAYPLPGALVFDETGVVLPDMHFVKAEGAFWGAEAVAKQLGLC
ncbi:hypothetical protein HRS9122_09562 [Pyrenophora teres f. teres]|nr:hypothetical protein HRS9122_09562 [Pyrenophora teres f. teres]